MSEDHVLDERLRRAFGAPPDLARLLPSADEAQARAPAGRRFPWLITVLLSAAALVVAFVLADRSGGDAPAVVLAQEVWNEGDVVYGCSLPTIDSDRLARHCEEVHGVAVRLAPIPLGRVLVHAPRRSAAVAGATVLSMAFPSDWAGGRDVRLIVIARGLRIDPSAGLTVFHRSLRGLDVYEVAPEGASAPRGLPLFR